MLGDQQSPMAGRVELTVVPPSNRRMGWLVVCRCIGTFDPPARRQDQVLEFLGAVPWAVKRIGNRARDRDSEESKLRSHPARRHQKGFSFVVDRCCLGFAAWVEARREAGMNVATAARVGDCFFFLIGSRVCFGRTTPTQGTRVRVCEGTSANGPAGREQCDSAALPSGGCFLLVPVEGCECWKSHVLDI